MPDSDKREPTNEEFWENVPAPNKREPTPEELRSTNLHTPRQLDKRVRITAPDGSPVSATVKFEDGEDLLNVLRVVIVIEVKELAKVFITRYHPEIGKVVYEETECLVG